MSVKVYNKEEEILLSGMLGIERVDLYMQDLFLSESQSVQFEDALKKRAKGEPLQYIMGKTEFFGLPFFVEPGVFIPRPETEVLVENVILRSPPPLLKKVVGGDEESKREILRPFGAQNDISVLDLCTGSGCIAICLAKYMKCGKIIATDISEKALETAAKNAVLNGVAGKIDFKKANLFEGIGTKFDIIVCNPPYIKREDLKNLPREVSCEPVIALDGGEDGLNFYKKLAVLAPEYLSDGGILAMELGDGQAEVVREILGGGQIIKDLNGIYRVLIWENKG